jgi:predicted DNA binding CopG/RHH family protein
VDFEWDLNKEVKNIKKHGVSFLEAAESFSDSRGLLLRDEKHTQVGRSGSIGLGSPDRAAFWPLPLLGVDQRFGLLGADIGENLGGFMRQPKLSNLSVDIKGTRSIRSAAKSKKVKITINIDQASLSRLKSRSDKTGVPYQRLLNQILKEALKGEEAMESRLEKLERELERLKKKVA